MKGKTESWDQAYRRLIRLGMSQRQACELANLAEQAKRSEG